MQNQLPPQLTQRQKNEKEHYDQRYAEHPRDSNGRFVFPPAEHVFHCVSGKERRPYNQDWEFLREIAELNLKGKTILEVGCGTGAYTVVYAHLGARVFALDLSETAIAVAAERARFYGFEDRITFVCTSAEDIDYPDETFDAIVGAYILHHIEIDAAARGIRRMLKPGGTSVFLEWVTWRPFDAIRSNSLVRKLFPAGDGDVTADERKIDDNDLAIIRRYFRSLTIRRFYTLARIIYFFPRLFELSIRTDYWLQKIFPPFNRMGGAAIIRMDK
jgi:2-polyprenyl-3-methyl-5-hydroxy-6-metoxy-1,4-benzoquinol methylase